MKKFFETGLMEAGTYDEGKGELTLTVIQPGFNTSRTRYYPEDMLRRDHKVFEGAKMFVNHPTKLEEKERPEGSVNSWVGQIKSIWAEADGKIRATCAVIDESFRSKLRNLAEHNLLGQMGVSIRAAGEAREAEIQGTKTNIIERLIRGRSVDFVTFPGAGGMVEAMESESETDTEEDNKMEEITKLTAQLEEAKAEAAQLKQMLEESEREIRKAKAKAEIDEYLSNSTLPEMARTRISKRFAGAEASTGIQEAISEEEAYLSEIESIIKKTAATEPTKAKAVVAVKNLGESNSSGPESMVSVYKNLGMSDRQAKIAAGLSN